MSCIRQYDGFSKPILLKYKGEEEFNTVIGGILSVMTSLLLFGYGI